MAKLFFSRRDDLSNIPYLSQELQADLKGYPSALLLADKHGKIVWCNVAAQTLLQAPPQEVAGTQTSRWGIAENKLKTWADKKTGRTIFLNIITKQADSVSVALQVSLFAKGHYFLLVLNEREEEAYKFLNPALQAYPQAIILQKEDGECILCNKQAEKLFGLTGEEKGKNIYGFLPKELVPSLRHLDQNLAEKGVVRTQLSYRDSHEKEIFLDVHKVFVAAESNRPHVIVNVFVDNTLAHQEMKHLLQMRVLLNAVLDNIPLGLYTRDNEHNLTFFNRQSLKMLNEKDVDMMQRPNLYQTEKISDDIREREMQILKDGRPQEFAEEEYIDSEGQKKILRLIKVPLYDAGPKPLVLSIVDDVTERCRQEKELKRINSILSAVVQHMPIALYVRSSQGKLLLRNKQCETVFKVPSVSLIDPQGSLPHETPEQIKIYMRREQELLSTGQPLDIPEEIYRTGDGETKILHMIKIPVVGDESFVITLAEDITQRKGQERAVVESKDFLQDIIDNLPVSLSVKNYEGDYILWNKKSEEIFGVRADEVIGHSSYRKDLNKDQAEFVRETDLKVFQSRRPTEIAQELISSPKEGIKIMHTVRVPLFDGAGEPRYLLNVSEDITAKMRMEKQIREVSDKNMLLVDHTHEGVLIAEDKKIIYANRAFVQMVGGTSFEEIKGRPLADFIDSDYHVFFNEAYDAALAGTETEAPLISLQLRKQNGEKAEVDFAAVSSRYLGRKIVLCSVQDVTRSSRQQRALQQETQGLQEVFEKHTMPTFILRSNGYISRMNEACRNLFGFTLSDQNFYRNVYIRPALSLAVRRQLKAGQPAQMDYMLDLDKASQTFPNRIHTQGKLALHLEFVPISKRDTKEGVEADWAVFVQTLSKPSQPVVPASPVKLHRKPSPPQLSAQAAKAEELLILPNSEPYVLCGPDFKMQVCNELFCSLCQLSKEELLGQDIRLIVADDSREQFDEDLRTLQETGTLSHRDYNITQASGLEKNSVRLMGVKEADGRYLFVLRNMAFHQQIMKILEERSAQLNALLDATDGIVFSISLPNETFGTIVHANHFLAEKVGIAMDELVQMPFASLFENSPEKDISRLLASLEKELFAKGKISFEWNMLRRGKQPFEAEVTVTRLVLPKQETALVVVRDLSAQKDQLRKDFKEVQELASIRQALPALYIKTDGDGVVREVVSNLPYWPAETAEKTLLGKKPDAFWPAETADQAVSAVKEALSLNVPTNFELTWELDGKPRYFWVQVSPVIEQGEAVLWVTDVSADRAYNRQLYNLYRLTYDPNLSLTEQVDRILQFGLETFQMELGCVLRFEDDESGLLTRVLYANDNSLNVEQGMAFLQGDCLRTAAEGNVVLWNDTSVCACRDCIHLKKGLGSLLAAPLYVGEEVMGVLCFASSKPRRNFAQGAEELMGILSRVLSLRIELRQTGKKLDDAARSFARTLEYLDKPAVMLDLNYKMLFVNRPMLDLTGRHWGNMQGRNFFREIVRDEEISCDRFAEEAANADGNHFTVQLEVYLKNGLHEAIPFEVFVCKDASGQQDAYALIATVG